MRAVKVLVVDDFEPFRRVVCSALQQGHEFQVIEASDGLEAIQRAEELQPDLILLDIGLQKLNGLEVARRVHKLALPAKILFLSQEFSHDIVDEALRLGASGYVHKLRAQSELLPAIEAVLEGNRFISGDPQGREFGDSMNVPANVKEPVTVLGENLKVRVAEYPWQKAVMGAFQSPSDSQRAKINIAKKAVAARPTDNQPDWQNS